MNNLLKKLKEITKKPKVLIILGFVGIGLIFLSSFIPSKKEGNTVQNTVSAKEYKKEITEGVKQIVTSVSGDKSPTVVVTLESGVKYTYADSGETDKSTTSGNSTNQDVESSKRSYVTVKDSSGAEKALVITENMPEIRGVAVICLGGENSEISEKVINAVTAALNISSKRVFVSGGINQ